MKRKTLIYAGFGLIIILLIASMFFNLGKVEDNFHVQEDENVDLEKYRSENIPEECQMPVYEEDVVRWKEHLSHHKQTWYCLEYYEEIEILE